MAIPATTALLKVYDTENADNDIKVTGYQWKWQHEYLGEGVKFMSNLRTSADEINGREPKGSIICAVVSHWSSPRARKYAF